MGILRAAAAPLVSARTYTRWVYLVLGGALFTPFFIAVFVLMSLVTPWGPTPGSDQSGLGGEGYIGTAVAALLGGATGFIPGVHAAQSQVARSLLGGPLADEPRLAGADWRTRVRGACWLALLFAVGLGVCLATMVVLTDAASLALIPLFGSAPDLGQRIILVDWSPSGAERWAAPFAGAGLLVLFVYAVALLGAGASRLARPFLGASAADRLAAVRARAADLGERNRLAAELHDSIGHALSVVALQAGAASRVIERDPEFARGALEAIADQARTATAELDHVLGLLREKAPGDRAPQRALADVPHLVEAARTAGTEAEYTARGPVGEVPPVVSRELYRICQEGVTNALRHGAGGPVRVRVDAADGRVRVEVVNPCAGRRPRRRGGGRGLEGARERVRLLGGELRAGAEDGVWRLEADIPWKSGR
ncbi:sensor histidine kinase [Nocardiopsis suaedae]|uniref:histidine kinase n=1 Tax=Nocardiopsis suaedae TaxID=3018444 RepID=A0ABT4TRG1_9ACTN|nr:histidine kinase [Nocardiopsis suaedae]MDA2807294.1 histidine kinase [Nocardiopsis suaedae]